MIDDHDYSFSQLLATNNDQYNNFKLLGSDSDLERETIVKQSVQSEYQLFSKPQKSMLGSA